MRKVVSVYLIAKFRVAPNGHFRVTWTTWVFPFSETTRTKDERDGKRLRAARCMLQFSEEFKNGKSG